MKRKWLTNKRKQKNLTLRGLAKKADIDFSYLSKIESGERRPSPEVAMKIALILGFKWTRFFEEKNVKGA